MRSYRYFGIHLYVNIFKPDNSVVLCNTIPWFLIIGPYSPSFLPKSKLFEVWTLYHSFYNAHNVFCSES